MSCRVGCAGIACKLPQQQRQDLETGQRRNEVASDLRGVGPWWDRADKFGGGRGPRAGDASGKGWRRGGGAYEIRHSGRCIESRRDGEPPSALPAKKKRRPRDQIHVCTAYLANQFPSPVEPYVFEEIRELRRRGMEVDLMRAHGHEVALFSMADARGEATKFDQHFVSAIDFKNGRSGLVRHGQASHPRTLLTRGPPKAARHDQRVSARRGSCAQHLSPSVTLHSLGAESARRSGDVSPERLQAALSQLQHGGARARVRALSWRKVLARSHRGLLFRASSRKGDAGRRGLSASMAAQLRELCRSIPRSQPICEGETG